MIKIFQRWMRSNPENSQPFFIGLFAVAIGIALLILFLQKG